MAFKQVKTHHITNGMNTARGYAVVQHGNFYYIISFIHMEIFMIYPDGMSEFMELLEEVKVAEKSNKFNVTTMIDFCEKYVKKQIGHKATPANDKFRPYFNS